MKFKYNQTEEGDVNVTFADGRKVTVILHQCGELDFEGFEQLTEQESDALTNWVVEKFSVDTKEYACEL